MEETNSNTPTHFKKATKEKIIPLPFYDESHTIIEIGVDEAGRGPMFGRVYAGAVVWSKNITQNSIQNLIKDSKLFSKSKKGRQELNQAYQYIKDHSIAYAVAYEDEKVIDKINILQATQSAMCKAIKSVLGQISYNSLNSFEKDIGKQLKESITLQIKPKEVAFKYDNVLLLIDGNYFKPSMLLNPTSCIPLRHVTIEGGDNKYMSIAAASILAKVERDKYICELCIMYPMLNERYDLDSNKGYGSKKHMEGINAFGITQWHRRTFGKNKTADIYIMEK